MAKPIDLTGQKFGMLTVTKRADNDGRYVTWYCDCECGTSDFIVRGNDLKRKSIVSCGCKSKADIDYEIKRAKLEEKEKAKKLSEQELQEFDDLYQYVRKNIMGYDENQALPSNMVLRLKGLSSGKFIENNNTKNRANYSYVTILNTFKFCSPTIQNALITNRFKDEMHKFNYVLKIVEPNINDVYLRMKNVEKAKKEAEKIDISQTIGYINTFKKKEKKKINNRLNELW